MKKVLYTLLLILGISLFISIYYLNLSDILGFIVSLISITIVIISVVNLYKISTNFKSIIDSIIELFSWKKCADIIKFWIERVDIIMDDIKDITFSIVNKDGLE